MLTRLGIRTGSKLTHAQEMTLQDYLNMQEFVNQLPSPQTKTETASPRTAEYAMMKELYGCMPCSVHVLTTPTNSSAPHKRSSLSLVAEWTCRNVVQGSGRGD